MKKIQKEEIKISTKNPESLAAVHTHTHTHTSNLEAKKIKSRDRPP